jgi:subtilisin family serine protease
MKTNIMRSALGAACLIIISAALPLRQSSGLSASAVLSASAMYGQPDIADRPLFYYSHERQIPLTVSTEKIGLYFPKDADPAVIDAVIAADADFAGVEERETGPGLRLVRLREGFTANGVLSKVSACAAVDGVQYASPVFVSARGHESLLTGTFMVSFERDVTDEAIDAMNVENGVEIVRVKTYKQDILRRYLLRAATNDPRAFLDTVNRYYEDARTRYAVPNFHRLDVFQSTTPDDTYYGNQWHLPQIDAPDAWDVETGDPSITIAIIDSGVDYDHEDLWDNVWENAAEIGGTTNVDDDSNGYVDDYHGWDFFDDDNDPDDDYHHGTCCAGLAAAVSNNGLGVAGVAWECGILPLRPMGAEGYTESACADAIDYAWENGADVLSCSWGWEDNPVDAITYAIQDAKRYGRDHKGSVVVFASGNDILNPDYVQYPASLKEVIAVGATNVNDGRYCYSCYGPELDVVAPSAPFLAFLCPSEGMWTTDITGLDAGINASVLENWGNGNYTKIFNGTSASCPVVAGLAGLILSLDPSLTAAQVQAIIQFSAEDGVGDAGEDTAGRDEYMGYGRVNTADALDLVQRDRFVIRDEDGAHVASFDSVGNFVLEGGLIESAPSELLYAGGGYKAFVISGAAKIVTKTLTPSQMMLIAGKLYENVPVVQLGGVSVSSFRIKNVAGITVALVNSEAFINVNIEPTSPYTVPAGSLILAGRAFLGYDPDRESSQGE